jgi:hypothetical protein
VLNTQNCILRNHQDNEPLGLYVHCQSAIQKDCGYHFCNNFAETEYYDFKNINITSETCIFIINEVEHLKPV